MKRLFLLGMMAAPLACAHEGEPLQPHDFWKAWSFDPAIVIPLLLTAALYLRGAAPEHGVTQRQKVYFWSLKG